ncbi:hypothetical protein D3C81_2128870 [compost metagenome]
MGGSIPSGRSTGDHSSERLDRIGGSAARDDYSGPDIPGRRLYSLAVGAAYGAAGEQHSR